ncbi:MAG: APC family permease [Deltaproteobacteria bacterium]|nr:APC family permease [Deltaproteobacteria bacterium]
MHSKSYNPPPEPGGTPSPPQDEKPTLWERARRFLLGAPRSLADRSLFHRLALIPLLAWVGLGADGLSSSAYGPEEAFRTLREHTYLAVFLALMMIFTVFVISIAYNRIIEVFSHGGGGYLVATKLLGEKVGLVSGCALIVDYVLTITVSIAAAGDALFSFLPIEFHQFKLVVEIFLIIFLTTINIRGVKESVIALTPIFALFLITHTLLILGGIIHHTPEIAETTRTIGVGFKQGFATLGAGGLLALFVHAYSLGGGTYTGIEAVSNGLAIMREPRVETAKRTMMYMAFSLSFMAAGLLFCYLLWNVAPVEGKTLNAVLIGKISSTFGLGNFFVIMTLITEGALLVVAAQAGFLGGPRILANMAVDSWMPHRFGAFSDRLTTQNGIVMFGVASLLALLYTHGDVRHLVVMYSINVFLTFSLSMLGMFLWTTRRFWRRKIRVGRAALFLVGFLLCGTILVITVMEKFLYGGWVTLVVTGSLIVVCYLIRHHYRQLPKVLAKLYAEIGEIPAEPDLNIPPLDPSKPTAAVLVGGYGELGIHTVLNIFRIFPGHFKNLIFISVGVIDSGGFKGEDAIESLRAQTEENLKKYVELARKIGIPAEYFVGIGTEAVEEGEKLCLEVAKKYPQTTYFAGKIIFQKERWYQRLLHNETALAIQKRLQWDAKTMVIIPARVR